MFVFSSSAVAPLLGRISIKLLDMLYSVPYAPVIRCSMSLLERRELCHRVLHLHLLVVTWRSTLYHTIHNFEG